MHKVNRFVKLAQEKGVVRLTDCLDMTIAVDWDVKPQTEQTKQKLETWPISLNPKYNIKVTAHTWAIFFPKNRIFSFFDIL